MGIMLSIDEISTESNLMEIEFKRYKQQFLVNELYCINPRCNCQTVKLDFLKESSVGKYDSRPISFSLNLKTFKTTDIEIDDPSYDFAYIISTFQDHLGDFITDYNKHYRAAKQYGIKYASRHISKEEIKKFIDEGLTVGYHEIQDNPNPIELFSNGSNYLVIDEYCMDPKCDCDKVKLYYVRTLDFQVVLECDFNFAKSEFTIIGDTSGQYDHLAYALGNDSRNLLALYKSRYNDIKGIKDNHTQPVISDKIGRNIPCPCGSGKKYKHCCGK
jgi:SEC-C motif